MNERHHDDGPGDNLGLVAHYSCGCAVMRDHDDKEYIQPSMLCPGGGEHLKRVLDPQRDTEHLWKPTLFDKE